MSFWDEYNSHFHVNSMEYGIINDPICTYFSHVLEVSNIFYLCGLLSGILNGDRPCVICLTKFIRIKCGLLLNYLFRVWFDTWNKVKYFIIKFEIKIKLLYLFVIFTYSILIFYLLFLTNQKKYFLIYYTFNLFRELDIVW